VVLLEGLCGFGRLFMIDLLVFFVCFHVDGVREKIYNLECNPF
jgi:hypothetical protein